MQSAQLSHTHRSKLVYNMVGVAIKMRYLIGLLTLVSVQNLRRDTIDYSYTYKKIVEKNTFLKVLIHKNLVYRLPQKIGVGFCTCFEIVFLFISYRSVYVMALIPSTSFYVVIYDGRYSSFTL